MDKGIKAILDGKNEEGLKHTISVMTATKHKDKDEIIEYCELRLSRLNRDDAEVEMSEVRQQEFFQ